MHRLLAVPVAGGVPVSDQRPRCEATVRRWVEGTGRDDPGEAEYAPEPCGRLAKTTVRVGSRDVPACNVHDKVLRRLGALA